MVFQEAQDNGSLKGISLDKTPGQMLLSISKAEIFLTSFTLKKKSRQHLDNRGTQPRIHILKEGLASTVLPPAGDSNSGRINHRQVFGSEDVPSSASLTGHRGTFCH